MSNFVIQIIRTVVPMFVGLLVSLLASVAIPIPESIASGLELSLGTLAASLYYIGVAWLERKWSWFGWLLGVARNPVYPAPVHVPTEEEMKAQIRAERRAAAGLRAD